MSDRIRPFSNGGQYADWTDANCSRCKKGAEVIDPGGSSFPACEIEAALLTAYCTDGNIDPAIAARMAYTSERYCWPCGEVEWTEEWKTEYQKRHPEASR